jgi:hypothetical protein
MDLAAVPHKVRFFGVPHAFVYLQSAVAGADLQPNDPAAHSESSSQSAYPASATALSAR